MGATTLSETTIAGTLGVAGATTLSDALSVSWRNHLAQH